MKTWQAIDKIGTLIPKFYKKPSKMRFHEIKRLMEIPMKDPAVLPAIKKRMKDSFADIEKHFEAKLNARDNS